MQREGVERKGYTTRKKLTDRSAEGQTALNMSALTRYTHHPNERNRQITSRTRSRPSRPLRLSVEGEAAGVTGKHESI